MGRFSPSTVVGLLSAFEGDFDDGLDAYYYVSGYEEDANGNAVTTITFEPVVDDGEDELRIAKEQAESFRVKIFRL